MMAFHFFYPIKLSNTFIVYNIPIIINVKHVKSRMRMAYSYVEEKYLVDRTAIPEATKTNKTINTAAQRSEDTIESIVFIFTPPSI